MKSPEARIREANAVLSEVLACPSVPNGLRRLAAAFVQESQDDARRRARSEAPTLVMEMAQLNRRNVGDRNCSFCPNNHGVDRVRLVSGDNGNVYACGGCRMAHASMFLDEKEARA